MLVLVPTREDVLAIRSIEEAFDLWTRMPTRREVALIRVALDERLIALTQHAWDAAAEESITEESVWRTVRRGSARSKDVDDHSGRQIGINFDGRPRGDREMRVKVSWQVRYFIPTVHSL